MKDKIKELLADVWSISGVPIAIFTYLALAQTVWIADPYGLVAEYHRCELVDESQLMETGCFMPTEVGAFILSVAWPITWSVKASTVVAHNVVDLF